MKQGMLEAIAAILHGEMINVIDASGTSEGICIGDFREIGWAERCTDRGGIWYEWNGPGPIQVSGQVIQPGQSTTYIEMDWT